MKRRRVWEGCVNMNGQALGESKTWYSTKVKAWTLASIGWDWILSVPCLSFVILGQLPPSQFPHLENCIEYLMYLMRNLTYFIPDEKLDNAGAFLSWYTLREKPILLLYCAYYYDSANSYAEHRGFYPPISVFLWMLSLTLCEGQILTWHLHFPLPLPQYEGNLPFKLKGDMMFLSIANPSCLKSDILMWLAGCQSGRCSIALVQYTALMWQWIDTNIPAHYESKHSLPMPGCSEILLRRYLWMTWWDVDLLLN